MFFKRKEKVMEKVKQEIGEIIEILNATTLCFTGHRSQKLPWGFNEDDKRCKIMKKKLREQI